VIDGDAHAARGQGLVQGWIAFRYSALQCRQANAARMRHFGRAGHVPQATEKQHLRH
jgi:hypothetical protein